MKIEGRWICEFWICEDGVNVVTSFAPICQSRTGKFYLFLVGPEPRVEINILVNHIMIIGPVTAEQISRVEIDNVVREKERNVIFLSRSH